MTQLQKAGASEQREIVLEQAEIGVLLEARNQFDHATDCLRYETWSRSQLQRAISELDLVERQILNAKMYDAKLKKTALTTMGRLRKIRQAEDTKQELYLSDKEQEIFTKAKHLLRDLDILRGAVRGLASWLQNIINESVKHKLDETWYCDEVHGRNHPQFVMFRNDALGMQRKAKDQLNAIISALQELYRIEQTVQVDLKKYEAIVQATK